MAKSKNGWKKCKFTPRHRKAKLYATEKANDNARDQFAALGRYVQSFEEIVSTLRWHCHRIMLGEHLGISNPDQRAMLPWWNITSLILHYDSITARPLLDIWRSLLAEKCKALMYMGVLSEAGNNVVKGVSDDIASEFADILEERNRLIHSSWRIGRWMPFENVSDVNAEKYKVRPDGLTKRTDLPKNFEALIVCGNKCQRLHLKLGRFLQFFHYQPQNIENVFKSSTKPKTKQREWIFIPPAPPKV